MKHSIVFKQKDIYASFPLLGYIDGILTIGFFTAPQPDHMGIFDWNVRRSHDEGETWEYRKFMDFPYDWPAASARERSDRFTTTLPEGTEMITGSTGFIGKKNMEDKFEKVLRCKGLFQRTSTDNWKTAVQWIWEIPNVDIVLTFPRHLQIDNLIFIPAYAVLENGLNRAFVWRSSNGGKNWRLHNMFPDEINANEIAFVETERGILAHIRSDTTPFIMESWSYDGITWTYPTYIHYDKYCLKVAGGPSHLLRLQDGRILDTYGYRFNKMGIKAVISEDEGVSWISPTTLRNDGGYSSSLHKRRWRNKFKLPHAGNDVGYPTSVQLGNESILTAYYITCEDRITHIATTNWDIDDENQLATPSGSPSPSPEFEEEK